MDSAAIKQAEIKRLIDLGVFSEGSFLEGHVSTTIDNVVSAYEANDAPLKAFVANEARHSLGETVASKESYKGYAIFTVTSSPTELYKTVKENALPEDEAHYFNTVADAETFIDNEVA